MNKHNGNLINVIATGFIVMVLLSLVLFWGRLFYYEQLFDIMPKEYRTVTISPSRLVPSEPRLKNAVVSNEPNSKLSEVYAYIERYGGGIEAMGIIRPFEPYFFFPVHDREGIYYWYADKDNYLYFNNQSGLFNFSRTIKAMKPTSDTVIEQSKLFAGPNGVSETNSPTLGRFDKPFVAAGIFRDKVGLYDVQQRTFYLVDFNSTTVTKGLELAKGDSRQPIAMGRWLGKERFAGGVNWQPPKVKDANESWIDQKFSLPGVVEPNEGWIYRPYLSVRYIPVLDKNGQIYLLDIEKWSLTNAGFLPVPQSLFLARQENEVARPQDVLGYQVEPVYAVLRLPGEDKKPGRIIDTKYLGMCVSSVSREGTSLAVAVFDPNGRLVYSGNTNGKGISSAEMIYSGTPWAPFWTTIEFILENLQPPVFEVASYLFGNFIEVSAGHRSLFILPNSFLGMIGRSTYLGLFLRQWYALWLMAPSLILSVWLGLKVKKDATLTGLSTRAKKWWLAGTIAFGLPAYITYRLTRHKEVLVTCQNCGMLRRPDMVTCHHCGSKWELPELIPPNWRICD